MDIILDIRKIVRWLYQVFGDMALWCWAHDPPFGWFGDRFLDVYDALTDLHYSLYQFAQEYEDLWERVIDVITQSDIFQLLQKWLNYAEDAWSWVLNSVTMVGSIVNDWWLEKQAIVKGWIDIATEGFDSLKVAWDSFWNVTWPELAKTLATLLYEWTEFWEVTFPSLVSFDWLGIWWDARLLDIDILISDTLKVWFPFYDDLVSLWDSILEFFVDPLTWLEKKFTDWFLGEE